MKRKFEVEDNTKEINQKKLVALQQLRVYLGSYQELNIQVLNSLVQVLTGLLSADKEFLYECTGELGIILLALEDREVSYEIKTLAKELKLKYLRLFKEEPKILRGNDNTDIYKDRRDVDGYITDLSLMCEPYSIQRIVHKTGDIEHFTEEIYIDSMGRYFRKIYEAPPQAETEDAIVSDIMSQLED